MQTIQNMWNKCKIHSTECRDGIHNEKVRGNKEISLAKVSKILAQSCIKGLHMIVLVAL